MRQVTNNIGPRLERVENFLKDLPKTAYDRFRSITPIDTGNARASTELNGSDIVANYDYSVQLNSGRSSQAPNGMTEPTIEHIRSEVRKL